MATCTAVIRFKPDKIKFETHNERLARKKSDFPCCLKKVSGRYQIKPTACKDGSHDQFFASAMIASTITKRPWEGLFNPKTKRKMTILVSAEGDLSRQIYQLAQKPNANLIVSGAMIYQHIGYAICPRIMVTAFREISDEEVTGQLTVKLYE